MIKLILTTLVLTLSLQAQSFSKQKLLGSWELSSVKLNQTVAFGNYIGKQRNETLELLFNPRGQMKIVKTGEVYNYEVIRGKLVIYETEIYRGNYKVRRKNRYDSFKIIGNVEGCLKVKLMKKKIPGYNPHRDLKMCKVLNFPQPTYQENILKFNF